MNLQPVVQETDNLTRPDHEAWPLHLAYRNAIVNNYFNIWWIFLVTAVAYNNHESNNLVHVCHIQRRKKAESARECGAVECVLAKS